MKDNEQNVSFTEFRLNGFSSLGEWRPFLFIPFFLMFLFAIIANSIIIYLVKTQESLHSPMYVLIGVMAAVDLIMPLFFIPNMLLSFLFNWNGISLTGCLIQMFGIHFAGPFQTTLLFWMALDRYFAICKPFYYHKYMEISNFMKFVVGPVIRNVLLVVTVVCLAGRLSFCVTNVIDHSFCEHMALVQLACGDISINNIVGLVCAFVIGTADCILVIVSYTVIFFSVLKSGKANMKALNTCITHLIVLSMSLSFFVLSFLLYRIRNNLSSTSRIFISIAYLFFPCCLHPIIYGWRTKEIRETFFKFVNNLKIYPGQFS